MKKLLTRLIPALLIPILVPYTITMAMTGIRDEPAAVIPYDGRIVIVENSEANISQSMDYSQYLIGMTARNLISLNEDVWEYPEFIKLNCLISNTLLTSAFSGQDVLSEEFLSEHYISDDDLKILWGEHYTDYMNTIKNALNETNGLVITCNNVPIKPFYHYISNGMTRSSPDFESYPYLKSVNTNKDLEEQGFLCVRQYSYVDFINVINENFENTGLDKSTTSLKENIQIISRDDAGYITQLQIGNLLMSGDDFMNLFQINSPSFTLTFQEQSLKIITKGIGHGYGISLSHALRMAKEGNTYTDIVKFFYENVEIKNYE